MRSLWRVGLAGMILALMLTMLPACSSGDTTESDTSPATQSESADTSTEEAAKPVETEVTGMPAEFPADVPVHPGTVTAYEPTEVTASTTVHQLTVESSASFDEVVAWYENELPQGWSVGFLEQKDESGREGKIALNGGTYTPASENGLGGGVLVGVFEGDATQIVTTVTVMSK